MQKSAAEKLSFFKKLKLAAKIPWITIKLAQEAAFMTFFTVQLDCRSSGKHFGKLVLIVAEVAREDLLKSSPHIMMHLTPFGDFSGVLGGPRAGKTLTSVLTFWESVPSTWICEPYFDGADDGCDCDCGAWDPDCSDSTIVFGCDAGADASCDGITASFISSPALFRPTAPASMRCHCPVGGLAALCFMRLVMVATATVVHGIPTVTIFLEACTIATAPLRLANGTEFVFMLRLISLPTSPRSDFLILNCCSWTCALDFYSGSDGCDCNCGAVDPDCSTELSVVLGCPCETMRCDFGFCAGACSGYTISVARSSDDATVKLRLAECLTLTC